MDPRKAYRVHQHQNQGRIDQPTLVNLVNASPVGMSCNLVPENVPNKEEDMSESGCASCSFRARYDEKPRSFLGRVWRWHANFCPGWKAYMTSLPEDEKKEIIEQYKLPPTKFA